jgi:uncharacterized membrane protein YhhN
LPQSLIPADRLPNFTLSGVKYSTKVSEAMICHEKGIASPGGGTSQDPDDVLDPSEGMESCAPLRAGRGALCCLATTRAPRVNVPALYPQGLADSGRIPRLPERAQRKEHDRHLQPSLIGVQFWFHMVRRLLVGISVAGGLAYLLPLPGSVLLKGASMAPLAALSFILARTYGRTFVYFGVAQALSCTGDVLLDLNPAYFTFGLAAFLLAHVEYTSVWLLYRPRPFRSTPQRTAIAVAVLLYAAVFAGWLVPGLGELSAPVALYIAAITLMVVTATFSRFSLAASLGAMLFLLSDSILATNKFKFPVPARDFLVWSTYYGGQLLMALTFMRTLTRDTLRGGDPNVRHHKTQSA